MNFSPIFTYIYFFDLNDSFFFFSFSFFIIY